MSFCNYCLCQTCQNGRGGLTHALTSDQKWICDVCYYYEVCLDRCEIKHGNKPRHEPCKYSEECESRPKLIGKWTSNEEVI